MISVSDLIQAAEVCGFVGDLLDDVVSVASFVTIHNAKTHSKCRGKQDGMKIIP